MKMTSTAVCRKAVEGDLEACYALIEGYAERGIMLHRSKEMLAETLDTFVVAEIDGTVAGCGALCRLGGNLVEIRSLGILDRYKGQGIGSQIVEALLEEARRQHIANVMALTYEVKFFERNGFRVVPKNVFPEKVWKDCMYCKKQYCCDEIAVIRQLEVQ